VATSLGLEVSLGRRVCGEAELDERWSYERQREVNKHQVGKQNTQKIERKNLNWRAWIKRFTRKTICFSKLESLHDTVIGLLTNKVELGVDIHQKMQL
jgi:insertion element IS1 protein InsB